MPTTLLELVIGISHMTMGKTMMQWGAVSTGTKTQGYQASLSHMSVFAYLYTGALIFAYYK